MTGSYFAKGREGKEMAVMWKTKEFSASEELPSELAMDLHIATLSILI
jgi:hypothetical protein